MDNNSKYLLVCFIAIGIGMVCILYAALGNFVRKLFLTKGEVVQGVVFDVEPQVNMYIGVGSDYDDFRNFDKVTIRFTTKKDEWITADLDSSSGFFIRTRGWYKQGDKLLVIYKPHNPYDFYVVSPKTSKTEQIVFAVAGFVFIAVGIYFLLTAP